MRQFPQARGKAVTTCCYAARVGGSCSLVEENLPRLTGRRPHKSLWIKQSPSPPLHHAHIQMDSKLGGARSTQDGVARSYDGCPAVGDALPLVSLLTPPPPSPFISTWISRKGVLQFLLPFLPSIRLRGGFRHSAATRVLGRLMSNGWFLLAVVYSLGVNPESVASSRTLCL